MERYGCFNATRDAIPQTPYEACVFIDNAIHHIWNREGQRDEDLFWILNSAHQRINDMDWTDMLTTPQEAVNV